MAFNSSIRYCDGRLHIDSLAVEAIAQATGSPVYIYSLKRIVENYRRLRAAFAPLQAQLHYSVKANGNLDILRALQAAGASFDCVSGGEIFRVLQAGAPAAQIVFAGVGKTRAEIVAALQAGVGWFNVENALELEYIDQAAAELGLQSARVALRFNPQVTAKTHPYIATGHGGAKFGLTATVIRRLLDERVRYPRIHFAGLHMHIGSQLGDTQATLRALEKALALIRPYPELRSINLGGGLPVAYRSDAALPTLDDFAAALAPQLRGYNVLLEPGRSIVADAGLLVAELLYVKRQAGQLFYIVDASMAELLRPALYGAQHEVAPLRPRPGRPEVAQVVGPVCESTDVLARERALPPLQVGDKVALLTAGAYGLAMASNYNARGRPPEAVLDISGKRWWTSRRRETYADQLRAEL